MTLHSLNSTQTVPASRRVPRLTGVLAVTTAVVLLSSTAYGAFAVLAPLDAVHPEVFALATVSTPEAEVTLPSYGGSAIGDADSDHLFAGVDIDTTRPIASLTKVVTALVVLSEHPIGEGSAGATITLTAQDAQLVSRYSAINGTTAPAPAGRTITQREVIELMIVHSANNYAETLAVWAFGSVDDYLVAARSWLDIQGLTGIQVADTTGFSTGNVGSPREMLRLARIAATDPVVSAAAAMPRVSVPGIGSYDNRNLIVGVDGVTGLKTGTLRASGASLLFSAEHAGPTGEHRVVGVVLNGPDHVRVAADVRALLESVRDDYHEVTLVHEGAVVARYTTPWGDTAELRVAQGVDDLVWGAISSVAVVHASPLQPGVDGEVAAYVELRYGGRRVMVPVQWVGSIGDPPLDWRLAQPFVDFVDALQVD